MGMVFTCNGCGKKKPEDQLKRVRVSEATMPGVTHSEIGLKSDRVTEGELCGTCVDALHDFVGEDSREVSLARKKPKPVAA